jgi:hypothetical protein
VGILKRGSIIFFALAWVVGAAQAADDPLASWNDGPAKQAIVAFVKETTTQGNPKFVPPEDRIATFDNEGTLWVSHSLYVQGMFALDRVATLAPEHPDWKDQEPFKAVFAGDREAMAKFTEGDWAKIIAATHAGMTTEAFLEIVEKWLAEAKHPRFKRPFTELIYQPMLEVMEYLRADGFRTCIAAAATDAFAATLGSGATRYHATGEHERWLDFTPRKCRAKLRSNRNRVNCIKEGGRCV